MQIFPDYFYILTFSAIITEYFNISEYTVMDNVKA